MAERAIPNHLNWDQHYQKTFRVVSTPAGRSSVDGKQIDDEHGRFSIVTPENGDAWTDWPDAPSEQIDMVKKNWGSFQGSLYGYKRDQIDRSYKKVSDGSLPDKAWDELSSSEKAATKKAPAKKK